MTHVFDPTIGAQGSLWVPKDEKWSHVGFWALLVGLHRNERTAPKHVFLRCECTKNIFFKKSVVEDLSLIPYFDNLPSIWNFGQACLRVSVENEPFSRKRAPQKRVFWTVAMCKVFQNLKTSMHQLIHLYSRIHPRADFSKKTFNFGDIPKIENREEFARQVDNGFRAGGYGTTFFFFQITLA